MTKAPGPYCGARKDDGSTCEAVAGAGTPHRGTGSCKHHGGCTPSHIRKAEKEIARQAVETYGLPRSVDPEIALLEEVARTAGHVDYLAAVVRALDPSALVRDGSIRESAHISPWVDLYQRERRHYLAVSKAAVDAGLAKRSVQLAESYGLLISEVLRAVAADPALHLDEEQRRAMPDVVGRHLAIVAG